MNIPERLPYILRIFRKCFEFGQFLTPLAGCFVSAGIEKSFGGWLQQYTKEVVYHTLN
jgi:hypothetical protein